MRDPRLKAWIGQDAVLWETWAVIAATTRGKAMAAIMSIQGCDWEFIDYTARRAPKLDCLIDSTMVDGQDLDCDDYRSRFIELGHCDSCDQLYECERMDGG